MCTQNFQFLIRHTIHSHTPKSIFTVELGIVMMLLISSQCDEVIAFSQVPPRRSPMDGNTLARFIVGESMKFARICHNVNYALGTTKGREEEKTEKTIDLVCVGDGGWREDGGVARGWLGVGRGWREGGWGWGEGGWGQAREVEEGGGRVDQIPTLMTPPRT